jgi:hypothetical protein
MEKYNGHLAHCRKAISMRLRPLFLILAALMVVPATAQAGKYNGAYKRHVELHRAAKKPRKTKPSQPTGRDELIDQAEKEQRIQQGLEAASEQLGEILKTSTGCGRC